MRRATFVVTGTLVLTGCLEWQQRAVTAPSRVEAPHLVRVTLERGERRLTLEQATVRADTVAGVVTEAQVRRGDRWASDDAAVRGDHVAFALRGVSELEEPATNTQRSGAAFALIFALPLGALILWLRQEMADG